VAALQQVDEGSHGEGEAEAGEADGERQQDAGGDVAALVVALQSQQHRDAAEDRADEADLERPEEILPGRAEEEQHDGREQRRPGAGAASHIGEHQHSGRHQEGGQDDEFGARRAHAEEMQQQLEDDDRQDHDVLVVRQQERVGGEGAPVHQEGPAVLEEGELGAERQQQRGRGGESCPQQDRGDGQGRGAARAVYGRTRPPLNCTKAFQDGLGCIAAPASKRPTESQKSQDSGRSFQENQ
jgi:hypothetical protein